MNIWDVFSAGKKSTELLAVYPDKDNNPSSR